jgi:hypothetical protein
VGVIVDVGPNRQTIGDDCGEEEGRGYLYEWSSDRHCFVGFTVLIILAMAAHCDCCHKQRCYMY